jgi:hypothetical protein
MDQRSEKLMIGTIFDDFASKIAGTPLRGSIVADVGQDITITLSGIESLSIAKKIIIEFGRDRGWTPKTVYQTFGEQTFFFWWTKALSIRGRFPDEVTESVNRAIESLYRLRSRYPSSQIVDTIDLTSENDVRSAGTFICLLSYLDFEITIRRDGKLYFVALSKYYPPIIQFSLGELLTFAIAQAFNRYLE